MRRAIRIVVALLVLAAVMEARCSAVAQTRAPQLDQRALFQVAGALYGVDPALLEAIAKVESNGDPNALSAKGARGLMQLMPGTARQFAVDDPDDPVGSTLGAAKFLDYLRRYQSRSGLRSGLAELLAAYNAGPGAVDKYRGIPPYPETQTYVRKVLLDYIFGPDLARNPAHRAHPRLRWPKPPPPAGTRPDALAQLAEIGRKRAAILHAPCGPDARDSLRARK